MSTQPHSIRPMEHRWGIRINVDIPVNIEVQGADVASGRLRNASVSGGLIATTSHLSMFTALKVIIRTSVAGHRHDLALAACVVRREPGAVAVEWRDMACQPLVNLLHDFAGDAPLVDRARGLP